jgi:hypothetical protein
VAVCPETRASSKLLPRQSGDQLRHQRLRHMKSPIEAGCTPLKCRKALLSARSRQSELHDHLAVWVWQRRWTRHTPGRPAVYAAAAVHRHTLQQSNWFTSAMGVRMRTSQCSPSA